MERIEQFTVAHVKDQILKIPYVIFQFFALFWNEQYQKKKPLE